MKAVSSTVLYTTVIFFFSYEAFLKNRVQFVVDTTTGETRSAAASASAATSERSMLRNVNAGGGAAGGSDGGGGEVGEKLNKIETAIAEMMKQMQQQQQQEQSAGSSNQQPQQPIIAQPPPPPPAAAAAATTSSGNNNNADDAYYELCQKKLDDLERVWDLRREGRQAATQKHGGKPARGDMLGVFDLFEPEAVCLDDERFGSGMKKEKFGQGRYKSFGDGPKFICGVDRLVEKASSKSNNNANKNNKNCLIYSVGSNNEIDFEMSVQEMMGKGNCELHTFDPTVDPKIFIGHEYTNFHDWGFGEDGVEVKVDIDQVRRKGHFEFTQMSLATAMEKLGHVGGSGQGGKKRGGGGNQGRKIDILKIDCEGCEFTALTQAFNAIADGKIKIDQVQVEVHAGKKGFERWPLIKELFDAADRANMRVFHKERNGWGCAGSRCIEYAFASNEFLRMANAYCMCP